MIPVINCYMYMVNSCLKLINKIGKCFFVYQEGGAPIAKKQDWTKQQKLDFKIAFSVRYL